MYTLSFTNGRPDVPCDTISEAIGIIRAQYPDAVAYDCSGCEVIGDDTVSEPIYGRVALLWENEAESENDDGSHAVAEITIAS